jgi:hypothetical protein
LASAHATAPDPTSVYRYYDPAGMLIYVGITRQGMGRNVQHNRKAEWWQYVARQEIEHHESRFLAAKREKELIRRFRPPFNKQHNIGHEELRAAYLGYVDKSVSSDNPLKLYKLLGKELPLNVVVRSDNELVLATRPEHKALAALIRVTAERVPLCPGKGRGRVLDVLPNGQRTLLVCRIHGSTPGSALACVAYKMEPKPAHARLDKVVLLETSAV